MNKNDFRKAYGLIRRFAAESGKSVVGFGPEGDVGLCAGFAGEASVFAEREISGGRFHLDATDDQRKAVRCALAVFAELKVSECRASRAASCAGDDSYDYT